MNEVRASDEPRVDETGRRISVGHELRRAREVRRVTLAQLAAETRIALRHLEALEQDRLEDLPGRLYARNFVRTVARTLGADEQELLDYFDYQSGRTAATGEADDQQRQQAGRRRIAFAALAGAALVIVAALAFALGRGGSESDDARAASRDEGASSVTAQAPVEAEPELRGSEERATPEPPPARESGPPSTAAQAVQERPAARVEPPPVRARPEPAEPRPTAAEGIAREPRSTPEEAAPAESHDSSDGPSAAAGRSRAEERAQAAVVEEEPVAAAAPPQPEPAPAPAPSESRGPRVRLAFSGPSWIEIVPEGSGEQVMGLKTAGQEVGFELESAVEVTVANAGNVQLWLDDQQARPLGAPGERRTLRLDARNWRSYLK